MGKIGMNMKAGALRDEGRVIRVLQQMDSAFHEMTTGGVQPGKERQDVIAFMRLLHHPRSQFVHRLWDHNRHWREFPALKVRDDYLRVMQPHEKIVTETICNEPQDTENKDFIENQIAILRYAGELGHRIGLGVIGVGGPKEQQIQGGTFDRLYLAIDAANQRKPGSAYLNKHEYWNIWPEAGAGFDDIPYQVLLVPSKLSQYTKPKVAWDIRNGRWLLGRSDWEAIRCMQLGIEPVPMLFTEFGWDGVGDPKEKLDKWTIDAHDLPDDIAKEYAINPNAGLINFWFERLKKSYGIEKFQFDMRGVGSLRKILNAIYPHLTFDQAVFTVLAHVHEVYLWRPHIHGAMLFTLDHSGEWGGESNTSGHNYLEEVQDNTLIAIGQLPDWLPDGEPIPVPEPAPAPEPVPLTTRWIRSTDASGTNIRQIADTNSAIVGVLSPEWVQAQVSVKPFAGAVYDAGDQWYEVQTGNVHGFVAAAYIEIRDLSPVPDSIQITFPVDRDDIDALISILKRQIEQLEWAKEGRLASQIAAAVYAAVDATSDRSQHLAYMMALKGRR